MTLCAFCGKNPATNYTTESDHVCRACAIGFELGMQFGEEFELYEAGKASRELIAKIEAQRADWEKHFDEQVASNQAMQSFLDSSPQSRLEAALEEINSMAQMGQSAPTRETMLVYLGLIRDIVKKTLAKLE